MVSPLDIYKWNGMKWNAACYVIAKSHRNIDETLQSGHGSVTFQEVFSTNSA
jgi:hypothetical protein